MESMVYPLEIMRRELKDIMKRVKEVSYIKGFEFDKTIKSRPWCCKYKLRQVRFARCRTLGSYYRQTYVWMQFVVEYLTYSVSKWKTPRQYKTCINN